jgi:hypothetical protein
MTTELLPNFWDHHGILFLIFITLFPRLTLFFSSVPFGGILWWLGFIFAPRILVAFLATVTYGMSNPILVAISWVVALSGESGEKYYVKKRIRVVRTSRNSPRKSGDVIEPEYERLD